jgi:hypothetical protein
MNIYARSTLLKKSAPLLLETLKVAKQFVAKGHIDTKTLDSLAVADPSPQKKYVGWMTKVWIKDKPSLDNLRNKVEEFDTLAKRGKIKEPDINKYKSFSDLEKEVNVLNARGDNLSQKDLESDYETVMDDENLLIMVPHTHEASRKLGLSHFAFRSCEDGSKDSAWCTTYKAPDHFNDYYYNSGVTLYYIKVRSESLIAQLKEKFPRRWKEMVVVALTVLPNGRVDGYDGEDKQISKEQIDLFTKTIGIE